MDNLQKLNEVRRLNLSAPNPIVIDLADAKTDYEISVTGTYFYIFKAPDQTSYITVKPNRRDTNGVEYLLYTGFKCPFNKLYITTPTGQTGLITIVIAAEEFSGFEIIDNRSSISQTMQNILDYMQGDQLPENAGQENIVGNVTAVELLAANEDRKGFWIEAKENNGGIIYIAFENTVSANVWVTRLIAGKGFGIDNYRGPVFALASIAGQIAGVGEW